jgi:hypothetical protein
MTSLRVLVRIDVDVASGILAILNAFDALAAWKALEASLESVAL